MWVEMALFHCKMSGSLTGDDGFFDGCEFGCLRLVVVVVYCGVLLHRERICASVKP